jgi:hypothetical protein
VACVCLESFAAIARPNGKGGSVDDLTDSWNHYSTLISTCTVIRYFLMKEGGRGDSRKGMEGGIWRQIGRGGEGGWETDRKGRRGRMGDR